VFGMGYFPAPGSIDKMPRFIGTIIDGSTRLGQTDFPSRPLQYGCKSTTC